MCAVNITQQLIVDFFRNQCESHPNVLSPARSPRPRGFAEEHRADEFRSGKNFSTRQIGDQWSGLSGKVYEASGKILSVILALYDDKNVLWLDNHTDDSDFEAFIRRELVLEWLPHRVDELLDLLIGTKLKFLGRPQLVHVASEVPVLTQADRDLFKSEKSEEDVQFIKKMDKRLAGIAGQIQPPTCSRGQNGEFRLNFCVWTKLLGKAIKIDCTFGPDYSFRYAGTQLAKEVGKFAAPRCI